MFVPITAFVRVQAVACVHKTGGGALFMFQFVRADIQKAM